MTDIQMPTVHDLIKIELQRAQVNQNICGDCREWLLKFDEHHREQRHKEFKTDLTRMQEVLTLNNEEPWEEVDSP